MRKSACQVFGKNEKRNQNKRKNDKEAKCNAKKNGAVRNEGLTND
jgi:hypothetical protein